MRIFILCTGRSGSSTFIKACQHIDNYTALHESRSKIVIDRFDYPDNHIEGDNRLSWHLGHLDKHFGNEAFYVHLKRDKDQTSQSFSKRYFQPSSMIDSYSEGIRMLRSERLTKEERLQVCYDYVDTVNFNIESFLSTKSTTMTVNLENVKEDFNEFWNKIGASGDLNSALKEFEIRHNSTSKRKLDILYRFQILAGKTWNHLKMSLGK